jgi:hypothetical protein
VRGADGGGAGRGTCSLSLSLCRKTGGAGDLVAEHLDEHAGGLAAHAVPDEVHRVGRVPARVEPREGPPEARVPVPRRVPRAVVHAAALDLPEELHRTVPDGAARRRKGRCLKTSTGALHIWVEVFMIGRRVRNTHQTNCLPEWANSSSENGMSASPFLYFGLEVL